jgi:hypothetical protein
MNNTMIRTLTASIITLIKTKASGFIYSSEQH